MRFRHHLSLGKVTDHNGSLNQFVSDEMRRLVMTILLFVAFLLLNPLVHLAQADRATRLLLALVSLGTYLVQLLIVPA
jgi:hypothetical protein